MAFKDGVNNMVSNPKVGAGVSAASVGAAEILERFPAEILGKLATILGILLSVVLIITHLRNGRMERQKLALEITALEQKEQARIEKARARREAGLPMQRADDV